MSKLEEFKDNMEDVRDKIDDRKEKIGESVDRGVQKTKSFMKKLFLALLGLGLVSLVLFFVYTNWTYSSGTRSGTLVKISQKGYVFKTYEGQLNLGGFQMGGDDGLSGNIWSFSVTEEDVYSALQTLEGKQVTVHYDEINKAMPWQGDTNYFISKVEEVQ